MIPPLDAAAAELSAQVAGGGFVGFKPYWTFAAATCAAWPWTTW